MRTDFEEYNEKRHQLFVMIKVIVLRLIHIGYCRNSIARATYWRAATINKMGCAIDSQGLDRFFRDMDAVTDKRKKTQFKKTFPANVKGEYTS